MKMLSLATKQQIDVFISDMQLFDKKKTAIEIEVWIHFSIFYNCTADILVNPFYHTNLLQFHWIVIHWIYEIQIYLAKISCKILFSSHDKTSCSCRILQLQILVTEGVSCKNFFYYYIIFFNGSYSYINTVEC